MTGRRVTGDRLTGQPSTRALVVLALLGGCSNLFAATATSDLADQIRASLSAHPAVSGDFTQRRTVPGLQSAQTSNGTFVFVRSEALAWSVTAPIQSTIAYGRRASTKGSNSRVNRMVLRLMSAQILNDDAFEKSISGTAADWQLALTPRVAALSRHLTSVSISGGDHVRRLSIRMRDDDVTNIDFSNVSPRQQLDVTTCRLMGLQSGVCDSDHDSQH